MELKELKVLFDNGGLKTVTIKRAPLMNGYILIVKTVNKNVHVMTSQREESNTPRAFKTIDAAAANAQKIGFKKISIDFT
ncbi:MAG: plasmid replication protein RepB [Moritella sp.]|uniref:plasmid replication protein RepB n=1 Tax=Moritella sp. TaxID=78556 RepID=UPI001D400AF9|nr:plasmid replication protein RepB [Moritella sp.]NQZ51937.1 plasmid replication protein RepB [Moritella sp.]